MLGDAPYKGYHKRIVRFAFERMIRVRLARVRLSRRGRSSEAKTNPRRKESPHAFTSNVLLSQTSLKVIEKVSWNF